MEEAEKDGKREPPKKEKNGGSDTQKVRWMTCRCTWML